MQKLIKFKNSKMNYIKISTNDGRTININKNQICSVEQLDRYNLKIIMSSGDSFVTSININDLLS